MLELYTTRGNHYTHLYKQENAAYRENMASSSHATGLWQS